MPRSNLRRKAATGTIYPSRMYKLLIEDDQGRKTEVPFGLGVLSLGRASDNQIRLDERNVSRKHARIAANNNQVTIEDLDSFTGIKINGDRISGRSSVFQGDRIQVGDFVLQIMGEALRARPEEITQKTQLGGKTQSDEVTNTQPMTVAPVTDRPPERVPQQERSEMRDNDENTAIVRLSDEGKRRVEGKSSNAVMSGPTPRLVCVKGPFAGKEWPLNKAESVIGRDADNDIPIDHRSMSRQHARIVIDQGKVRIVDLKSANGTLVNGEEYAQAELKRGDVIELGHVRLRVMWPGEAAPQIERDPSGSVMGDDATEMKSVPTQRHNTRNKGLWIALAVGAALAGVGSMLVVSMQGNQMVAGNSLAVNEPLASGTATPSSTIPPAVIPPAPGQTIQQFMEQAVAESQKEKWDDAIATIQRGLVAFPGDATLRNGLEKAQNERGAKTTFEAAQAAFEKGDYASAKELFEQIPDDSMYAGKAKRRVGEARTKLDAAPHPKTKVAAAPPAQPKNNSKQTKAPSGPQQQPVSPGPTPPPVVENKPAKPEPMFKDPPPAAETARDRAKRFFTAGNVALRANDLDDAIKNLTDAVRADASFADPHRSLGIAYARQKEVAKAFEHYQRYLDLNPNAKDADQVRQLLRQNDSQ